MSIQEIEHDQNTTYFQVTIGQGGRFHPGELFYMCRVNETRYVWRVDDLGRKTQVWEDFGPSGTAMLCNAEQFKATVKRVYGRNGYRVEVNQ